MDLIVEESEQHFTELLPVIAEDAAAWGCVHVHIAPLHEEALIRDGLSKQTLERIRRISLQIAQKMHMLGMDALEGRIFVFGDGDVMALFLSGAAGVPETVEKLRQEFIAKGLGHLFQSYGMQDKLASLLALSEEKRATAEDFKSKHRAAEAAETIFEWDEPNPKLTAAIQKKRAQRTSGVVLVIEDDLITRGLVASVLKKEYTVVQAKDARSGITAYIDHAPNIVLLDIHLPDFNGHEVLDRLRLLDPEAYVAMLSADSVTENVVTAHEHGAAGFIRKPFTKEKLIGVIERCPTVGSAALLKALGWGSYWKE